MNAAQILGYFDRVSEAADAIPRLRRFILDLAVRGKLVPQDPADELASELLARIAAEKIRLVGAGEARSSKPFPHAVAADIPFPLPPSWRWSHLATIGVLSPRNDAADDTKASFVPMTLIPAEYGIAHSHQVRSWGDIKKGYTHFAEGDVALAKITPCFENCKSTVFRGLTGGIGSGTTELHVVRPLLVAAEYILIFLKAPYFIEAGVPRMTGTAGQKRVPTEYFANSPFPLPPLAEQRRIVARVDELMVLCDQLEAARAEREATRTRLTTASLARLNCPDPDAAKFADHACFALENFAALTTRLDQVKQLRQTILNLAVRGRLVPQTPNDESASELLSRISMERAAVAGADNSRKPGNTVSGHCGPPPYDVPKGWTWIPFGRLIRNSESGWSPRTENYERQGDNWGVLKVSAVSWGRFLPHENKQLLPGVKPRKSAAVRQGDFLISRANTSELVGRAVVVDDEPTNLMMSDKIVRLHLTQLCDVRYMLLVNNGAAHARLHYAQEASGVSPSMKNISRAVILQLAIPLPPLAEQRRIVAKVDELLTLCDRLEASLARGEEGRSRLLEAVLHEALAPTLEEAA